MSIHRSSFINRYTPLKAKRVKPKIWNEVQRDPGTDTSYKNWIRFLPCVVCYKGWPLSSLASAIVGAADLDTDPMSECAHVGSRGLGQKCSDRQTIPLCVAHHRTGTEAHHVLGKGFWEHHEINRDELIRALLNLYPLK